MRESSVTSCASALKRSRTPDNKLSGPPETYPFANIAAPENTCAVTQRRLQQRRLERRD